LGDPGAYIIKVTIPIVSGNSYNVYVGAVGSDIGSSGHFYLTDVQVELGTESTGYQTTLVALNVTEAGVPDTWWLNFDGSDDFLSTSTIDLTSTGVMTHISGIRKNTDKTQLMYEFSNAAFSQNGSFALYEDIAYGNNWIAFSKGTTTPATVGMGAIHIENAPAVAVITGIHDIPGDLSTLRRNSTVVATGTDDKGGTAFGNYQFFVGRRNGATIAFGGRLYGLVVCDGVPEDYLLLQIEKDLATKANITI
jgi:hypothetical protein